MSASTALRLRCDRAGLYQLELWLGDDLVQGDVLELTVHPGWSLRQRQQLCGRVLCSSHTRRLREGRARLQDRRLPSSATSWAPAPTAPSRWRLPPP